MLTKLFPFFKKEEPKVEPSAPCPSCFDIVKLELRYNPNSVEGCYEVWSVGYDINDHDTLSDGVLLSCARKYNTRHFAEEHIADAEGVIVR